MAGDYSLLVSYCWNHNGNGSDFESVITWDTVPTGSPIVLGELSGSSEAFSHKQEPKDSQGGGGTGTGTGQQSSWSKTFILSVTAGTYNLELQMGSEDGNNSSIWDIVYILNRIA